MHGQQSKYILPGFGIHSRMVGHLEWASLLLSSIKAADLEAVKQIVGLIKKRGCYRCLCPPSSTRYIVTYIVQQEHVI